MRNTIAIALASTLALFWACADAPVEKPDNLIDEDKMVDIFYDLALLEGIKSFNPQKLQADKDANHFIYKKYSVDSLQFAQSHRYYASKTREYKFMYKRVAERLKKNLEKSEGTTKKAKLPDEGGVVK